MQRHNVFILCGWFLAFTYGLVGIPANAATPSFTLSASNVTFPLNGNSSIQFTLTSVDDYAGTVSVDCSNVDAPASAKVPVCSDPTGPFGQQYPLAEGETAQGSIFLAAFPVPAPASRPTASYLPRGAANVAFAGLLLFGLRLRRRSVRRLTLMFVAAGTLAGVAGISGCGSPGPTLTPGTYTYTLTASDIKTNVSVSTKVNVTVP